MRRVGSGQLPFAFADSPQGGKIAEASDVSEAKAWLLLIANDKEAKELTAQTSDVACLGLKGRAINLKSRMCDPQVRFCGSWGRATALGYPTSTRVRLGAASSSGDYLRQLL